MSGHPYREHRGHKVEKHRVSHIAGIHGGEPKHYARGGSVHDDEAEDRALIRKEVKSEALKSDGHKGKHRSDKAVRRAKGGHVHKGGHKSGKTNVNVIVAPGGGGAKPPMPMPGAMPPPPAGAAPPMMPPKPPMAPPPPGPMGSPPSPGLGGMPPRSHGGRAYKKGGAVSSSEKGEGKRSAADIKGKTGIGERTPIQHSGNKSDTQNIGRGKPITYATGGAIEANGHAGKQMGPKIGYGNNGLGRMKKAKVETGKAHEPWEPGIVR